MALTQCTLSQLLHHPFYYFPDSKQPISISLNATKITSNQVSLQWDLHSSNNVKPSEISIETTKLNDTIHISTDVVDFSMQKYSIGNLDEKTDYSVCLMTKKKGKILAKECINVTTLPRGSFFINVLLTCTG